MKYLLWIGLFLILYWFLRQPGKRGSAQHRPPAPREPEAMVTCAHCGVHLPVSESIRAGERHYCCAEHQRADQPQPH